MQKGTYETREKFAHLYLVNFEWLMVAQRVGFEPLLGIENKELTGSPLPHDPLETLKDPGRRTYCARDAIYDSYMA